MKHPYNTGKVLIGCRYNPPRPQYYITADDDRLQRALLGIRRPRATASYWIKLWSLTAFLALGIAMVAR